MQASVVATVGPDSKVDAGPRAKVSVVESGPKKGWRAITLTLPPGMTGHLYTGEPNGMTLQMSAEPLDSDEEELVGTDRAVIAQEQLQRVRKLMAAGNLPDTASDEQVLALCVANGVPFVDMHFPPLQHSLCRITDTREIQPLIWMRPDQYVEADLQDTISLSRLGMQPDDIFQGELGDCWLLSSLAVVASARLLDRAFEAPNMEQVERERALGAYRATVLQGGWWESVLVDTFLPMRGDKPAFARNKNDAGELWPSVFEKIYAKAYGSYAAIVEGNACNALTDLTGYMTTNLVGAWVDATKGIRGPELLARLVAAHKAGDLQVVSTPEGVEVHMQKMHGLPDRAAMKKRYAAAGLAMGHAYAVLDVRAFEQHGITLFQIRNPWGDEEWRGRWGDTSDMWQKHPDVAAACGWAADKDDGTFWIEWADLRAYFAWSAVCYVRPKWYDYRVRASFEQGVPTIVLELHVTQQTQVCLILSQPDPRGTAVGSPLRTPAAMLLSLAAPDAAAAGQWAVTHNSTADVEVATSKPVFSNGREVGFFATLAPSPRPYYVVPRIHTPAGPATSRPYAIGLLSEHQTGAGIRAVFRQLPAACTIFQHHTSFKVDALPPVQTTYQSKDPGGVFFVRKSTEIVHIPVPA
jgi:hypothetical protein